VPLLCKDINLVFHEKQWIQVKRNIWLLKKLKIDPKWFSPSISFYITKYSNKSNKTKCPFTNCPTVFTYNGALNLFWALLTWWPSEVTLYKQKSGAGSSSWAGPLPLRWAGNMIHHMLFTLEKVRGEWWYRKKQLMMPKNKCSISPVFYTGGWVYRVQ